MGDDDSSVIGYLPRDATILCRRQKVSGTLRSVAEPTLQRGQMEASSSFLITLGTASLLVSWVLLLIVSWKEEFAWGMCSLLLPPVGYCYAFFRMDKASSVIALAAAGWIMIWLGW